MNKFIILLLAAATFNVYAAPPSDAKDIRIVNRCGHSLQIGFQTNERARGEIFRLDTGKVHLITVRANWAGRIWARESCDVHDCRLAGAENPASLAEFRLSSVMNMDDLDYYDVSFVDGYNLPISIEPTNIKGIDELVRMDDKHCRISECLALPTCPKDLQSLDSEGNVVACESACSKYGTDQYCCTGKHNTAETCTSNHYAKQVKKMCPDSYSYAFDDATSVYGCRANAYQVVFCP